MSDNAPPMDRNHRQYQRLVQAGRQAYEDGADIDDAPFDIKWMINAWREGWIEAKDEAFDAGQATSTSA